MAKTEWEDFGCIKDRKQRGLLYNLFSYRKYKLMDKESKQIYWLCIYIIIIMLGCMFLLVSMLIDLGNDVIREKDIEEVVCSRIIDGDTLEVISNGSAKKVRLIGVDTPESVSSDASKNCEEGLIASEYTKSLIGVNQTLWLTPDTSDTDKYGRLLRYVWLEKPHKGDIASFQIKDGTLNAKLVCDGYAQAKSYEPDTKYSKMFDIWGKQAEKENLGITYKWKDTN